MEILQVLHKKIPQRKKIVALFHKYKKQDISKAILQIVKGIKKETKSVKIVNRFCIELYDILHYYIMFGKVKIARKVLRLLEWLALPMSYIWDDKRTEVLKKMCKMKI